MLGFAFISTFTTDNDVVGPEAEEGFQTTENDDTIIGTVGSTSTLNAGDQIDGGEGSDTLQVSMNRNFTGFSGDGFMKNVETVELSNEGSTTRTFSAAKIEDAENYIIDASNGAVTLSNLADTDATITIKDQASGTMTIGYATDVTKGDADVQDVVLENVGTVEEGKTSQAAVTLNTEGIEELNLTIVGDNVIHQNSNSVEAINVQGGSSLKITGVSTALKTFDGSESAGDLDIMLASASSMTSVLTGSGDDVIRATLDDLRANAKVDGGEGDDKLLLSGTTADTQYDMDNIQTIAVGTTGTLNFSARYAEGIETLEATKDFSGTANFIRMEDANLDINLKGANTGGKLTSDHSGTTQVNVTATDDDQSNGVAVELANTSSLDIAVSEEMTYTSTITANKATSVEAEIEGAMSGATISAAEATSGVFTSGEEAQNISLSAAKMTDLQIDAGGDFTLTGSQAGLIDLTVDTAGTFTAQNKYESIENVTLTGSGEANLGTLGADDHDAAISVTADGLSGLAVSHTETEDKNITYEVDIDGDVNLGSIKAGTGNVSIDLNDTFGDFTLTGVTGKNVTIDAGGVFGTAAYNGTIEVGDTLNFTGVITKDNTLGTIEATGEDFVANLTGGDKSDSFTITGSADTVNYTLKGDLNLGDTDMVSLEATAAGAGAGTLGVEVDASDLDNYDQLYITTGAGNDTITGGAGADTIKSGAGDDYIVAGGGADYIFSSDGAVTVDAGAGDDTIAVWRTGTTKGSEITGGAGDDTFIFGRAAYSAFDEDNMVDTIKDFNVATTNNEIFRGNDSGATENAMASAATGFHGAVTQNQGIGASVAHTVTVTWGDDYAVHVEDNIATFYFRESGSQVFHGSVEATYTVTHAYVTTSFEGEDALENALTQLDNNLEASKDVLFSLGTDVYLFMQDVTQGNMFATGAAFTGADQVVELQGISDPDDVNDIIFS